jgi:hypothetical protein
VFVINNARMSKVGQMKRFHHHHQPINVPTAGAQAFLMDYNRAITHQRLNVPSEARGAPYNKFLVTHPMTGQSCLTSAIALTGAIELLQKDFIGSSHTHFSLRIPAHLWWNYTLSNYCVTDLSCFPVGQTFNSHKC